MNMPCMSKPAYFQHLDVILNVLEQEAKEEIKNAGRRVRECLSKENDCEDENSVRRNSRERLVRK